VLTLAAAGAVLDLDDDFGSSGRSYSLYQEVFCFSSSRSSLADNGFRCGLYAPNKTQQFAVHRCDDLPLYSPGGGADDLCQEVGELVSLKPKPGADSARFRWVGFLGEFP
jgi:hypothetical protein